MIKKYPKQFNKVSNYLKNKFGINVLLGQMTAFMGSKNKKIFIHHNHNLEKNGLYANFWRRQSGGFIGSD